MFFRKQGNTKRLGSRRAFVEALEDRCLLATVDIAAVADTTLYEDLAGAISNGAGDHFFAGRTRQGEIRRGLVRFDIASAVPQNATINSVSLQLHVSRSRPGSDTVSLHCVLAAWGEGNSNAPGAEGSGTAAAEGDATWLDRMFGAGKWDQAGGDFAAPTSAGTSVGSIGDYTWSSPQMVNDVQGWLDTSSMNFGWILKGNEGSNSSAVRIDSRENATIPVRPVLTVVFTPDNEAPTDISLSSSSISEVADVTQPVTVGTLSAVDPDTNDSHTFALTSGPGSANNAVFQIVGDELQLLAGTSLDHETESTLSVRISATDAVGLSVVKNLFIAVDDANEPPVLETPLADRVVVGGTDIAFALPPGTFSDPDAGDTLTVSAELANGSPLPNWLTFDTSSKTFSGQPADEDAAIYDVTVTATDSGQPGLDSSDTMRIIVSKSTAPWQSPVNRLDVNIDGFVVPIDVLVLINELNAPLHSDDRRALVGLPTAGVGFFDVNGDGFATALDALQIINFLNENAPESESVIVVQYGSDIERQLAIDERRARETSAAEQSSDPKHFMDATPTKPSEARRTQRTYNDVSLDEVLDELF